MKDAVAYDLERKELSENIGFGINKLMSWKTLTGNDVTIRNERDYVMVTLHLKSEVLEETTQKTTQKTTQNLENEENEFIFPLIFPACPVEVPEWNA